MIPYGNEIALGEMCAYLRDLLQNELDDLRFKVYDDPSIMTRENYTMILRAHPRHFLEQYTDG